MSVRIGIGPGLSTPLVAQDYWNWVAYCEEAGIDSIWHSDQLLGSSLEPVTMLAALAGRTARMRFGTNAIVAAFRDPIVLAKEFATIDFLSGSRLLPVFGVGAASDPYWAVTGADPAQRGQRANEAIALVRLLLEQQEVQFEGRHFRFHGAGVHPRPGRPIPLWTGGHSPAAIRRTAMLGDGWLGGLIGVEEAGRARLAIEAALVEAGRTIDPDHYGVTIPLRIGNDDDEAVVAYRNRFAGGISPEQRRSLLESAIVGDEAEIVRIFRRYVDAGISKFVVLPIAGDPGDLMDQTRRLACDILPEVESV